VSEVDPVYTIDWTTCAQCERRDPVCFGRYEDEGPPAPACDRCCGHGNEDGWCKPIGTLLVNASARADAAESRVKLLEGALRTALQQWSRAWARDGESTDADAIEDCRRVLDGKTEGG
jgi:hypothetical protein